MVFCKVKIFLTQNPTNLNDKESVGLKNYWLLFTVLLKFDMFAINKMSSFIKLVLIGKSVRNCT